MKYESFLLLVVAQLGSIHSQDCNICGEGNSIGDPKGVVEFEYEGNRLQNNCKTWQTIVTNPVAISDEFCRNEMLQYTKEPCLCTNPAGELLFDLDTLAPTPSATLAGNPSPATVPNQVGGKTNTTEVLKCQQETSVGKSCSEDDENSSSSNQVIRSSVWAIVSFACLQITFFV